MQSYRSNFYQINVPGLDLAAILVGSGISYSTGEKGYSAASIHYLADKVPCW
jgi:hypothetical protein